MSAPKGRNWAFVVYPESAPAGWREMIAELHLPCLVSPLHDRDTDKDGKTKKAHHHVLLMFDGPTTKARVDELIEPFNGTKSAEYVRSLRGYARYLAHLDDPEKAQYSPEEITAYGGADVGELLKPNGNGRYETIGEMMDFCEEYNILEFADLLRYARKNRSEDWFPVLVDSAFLMSRYITSLRHSELDKQAMDREYPQKANETEG
jgi:hypothetical protein